MIFFGQITLFSAFRTWNMSVCLQLNWAVLGLISRKATFPHFLFLNYAVFSYMTRRRCSCLFVAKFTLFLVLSNWRLSFKLLCSQMQPNYVSYIYLIGNVFTLVCRWIEQLLALSQPKDVSCLFSANHPDVSQTTLFPFSQLNQAVFTFREPKMCILACLLFSYTFFLT